MASPAVRLVPGGTAPQQVRGLQRALGRIIDGKDDASLLPYDPAAGPSSLPPSTPEHSSDDAPEDAAPAGAGARGVLLATSGSATGTGRLVDLPAAALIASAQATHERLAGPGRWVACLPVHHVAGLQVLVRSHLAGTEPAVLDTSSGFRPAELADAVAALGTDQPGYLSLVPTQLARVLAAKPADLAPLRDLAAILVGGAAPGPHLLAQAREAGLPVVTTYGMTETGGGCVYDGRPLDGVEVATDADGRVWLTGPVLARGYFGDDGGSTAAFVEHDGRTWLRTNDHGQWRDGSLTVLGRMDDVLITGGSNVPAGEVARVVAELGVSEVLVVGVTDEEWGQLVTAITVGPTPGLATVREHVTARLGPHHAPRALVQVDRLPVRGLGKPDRQAAERLAAAALERQPLPAPVAHAEIAPGSARPDRARPDRAGQGLAGLAGTTEIGDTAGPDARIVVLAVEQHR